MKTINDDDFWTQLSDSEFIEIYRIADINKKLVLNALAMAQIRINESLQAVKNQIVKQHYISILDFSISNTRLVDDKDALVESYKKAVFSRAKAGLVPIINNTDNKTGQQQTEQYWLDCSSEAIDFLINFFSKQ